MARMSGREGPQVGERLVFAVLPASQRGTEGARPGGR